MLIWSAHKKIPENLHTELFTKVEENYKNREEFFTSFNNSDKDFSKMLVPYYGNLIEEMLKKLGMWKISTYDYYLWVQMYNSETTTHKPHAHFNGWEIISFNHIIDASNNKCFYFLDNDNNKIYPDPQKSGSFFAWSPWLLHGVDKVQEPNTNRLIVAGNICLRSYYHPNGKLAVESEYDTKNDIIWKKCPTTYSCW